MNLPFLGLSVMLIVESGLTLLGNGRPADSNTVILAVFLCAASILWRRPW